MNRMSYACAAMTGWIVVWYPLAIIAATPDVQLLHIAVLDTSSSMDMPERLEAAKKEIKSKVRQIPPTATTPWIIVTFDSNIKEVRKFVDGPDKLYEFIDGVSAKGGTHIARALERVVDTISAHRGARQLVIYLYSDGEDQNQSAIREQEARLEKIVGARAEDGLTQTLICRRWGSASAEMVARLAKIKQLQVIDGEDPALVQITLHPEITVAGCRWVNAALEIELSAKATVQKGDLRTGLPAIRIACTTNRTSGETTLDLSPDGVARSFTIGLEPALGKIPKTVTLAFSLKVLPRDVSSSSAVCVAALSREQISLSVDVPSPSSPTRLLPRITSVGTPTWVNLVEAVCAFEAELSIQVDGPIVCDKPILLASPLEVSRLEFSPKFIRPGSNIIQLQIQAKVHPAPDRTDLTFELRPPKQDVLRVEVSDTIDFSVIGPEPARLVLQSGGEVLSSLCVDSPGALTVTPVVLGAPRSAVPKETAAFFTFDRSLMLDMRSPEVPMFLPATILSQGDDNQSASFFFDAVKEGKVKVTLSPSSTAVCGSEYPITRTRPAPFKKVLFVAAVSLAILCLLFLPFRLFCRLQGLSLEPHSDVRKST